MNNKTSKLQNKNNIAILQYNLNKNKTTTQSVLNHPNTARFAIVALQEQYWSNYTNSSLIHNAWTLIESTRKGSTQPRTAIYINNAIIPTTSYEPIETSSSDVTAIEISIKNKEKPTLLINIYNPKDGKFISELKTHLQQHLRKRKYGAILIMRDFNL